MVLALNSKAHRHLSIQFQERQTDKRYEALLEGLLEEAEGTITLPFRLDIDNRPYQIYDEVHGAGWLPYNYAFTEKTDEPLISIQRPTHTPLEIWRGVWQHPPPPGYVERVRGLILWVEPDSS